MRHVPIASAVLLVVAALAPAQSSAGGLEMATPMPASLEEVLNAPVSGWRIAVIGGLVISTALTLYVVALISWGYYRGRLRK